MSSSNSLTDLFRKTKKADFEDHFRRAHQNDDHEYQRCTLQNICTIVSEIKAGVDSATIRFKLSSKLDRLGGERGGRAGS